tara:strand:+ start:44 stop:589 length:546 start_codon:yes stop_codon:yes gene_type:complete
MKRLLSILAIVAVATTATTAQDVGRTDGPEQSEYGKGGNPFGTSIGRLYLSGTFGSGFFEGSTLSDETGFMYGFDLGYEMHDWIGVQGGYTYLSDRDLSIYSVGTNFSYPWHPFVYNVSLGAGLYDPDTGDRSFGIAPGAGVDIVLGENVRLGLNYKHDFIFTDTVTTDMDRVYAGLKFFF